MVQLERPALPAVARRLRWPGAVIVVFGRDAAAFAERVASRARASGVAARTVRVELRHREGASVHGERDLVIASSPSALLEAMASVAPEAALTIGVGVAFAAAVESDLAVWIRAGESPLALPEAGDGPGALSARPRPSPPLEPLAPRTSSHPCPSSWSCSCP